MSNLLVSFQRKLESRAVSSIHEIPAFAGMTKHFPSLTRRGERQLGVVLKNPKI